MNMMHWLFSIVLSNIANKIQITSQMKNALDQYGDTFQMIKRGTVDLYVSYINKLETFRIKDNQSVGVQIFIALSVLFLYTWT